MKNEKLAWGLCGLALALLLGFGCSKAKIDIDRPEVALFAYDSAGVSLYMIFDLQNRGILCDKPSETEVLKIPSENINPKTFFDSQGNFGIVVSEENNKVTNDTIYGGYFFTDVGSGSEKRTIPAFKRKGAGEKAIGCAGSDIWLVDGERQEKIGQMEYLDFVDPEGEKRTDIFSRLSSGSLWLIAMGEKIFQREEKGSLTHVGWVSWRKITPATGKQLVILMTKGLDKNSKWAGRYDGKLYQDQ